MKNIIKFPLLFLLAITLLNACSGDCDQDTKCIGVVCLNGGTCSGGNCACTTGYEGTSCETEMRAKFLGEWDGTLECNDGTSDNEYYYEFSTISGDISGMITDEDFTCFMSSSNQFYIPAQIDGTETLSGSGELIGNTLTMNLKIEYSDGTPTLECTFIGTK
ncbi:MAG: hypothetical protein H6577_09320 [Lewinellaceae bacterium]|nr:hypothetical protein [Saprospiraceae bacterium]MCB9338315.1 hypothetical protein [Lewinellaceae bacterium]